MFYTEDPFFMWDGHVNGNVLSSGVYVYSLEIVCQEGYTKVLSGDLTIVR